MRRTNTSSNSGLLIDATSYLVVEPSIVEIRTHNGFGMRSVSLFWRGLCVFKISVRTLPRRTAQRGTWWHRHGRADVVAHASTPYASTPDTYASAYHPVADAWRYETVSTDAQNGGR